jgi:hypothetical protein
MVATPVREFASMNRHHYFLVGLIVLFVGLQFRFVESYVLNDKASRFLAQRFGSGDDASRMSIGQAFSPLMPSIASGPMRTVTPPDWIGWALLSVGSVLVLHSLVMPKPGG